MNNKIIAQVKNWNITHLQWEGIGKKFLKHNSIITSWDNVTASPSLFSPHGLLSTVCHKMAKS